MLTFSEKRAYITAKINRGMIQPGETYISQFIVDGGDSWTWRAKPELHAICLKYDFYKQ